MRKSPEEIALRPCPFCGGAAEQYDFEDVGDDDPNFGGSVIQCTKCGASSPVHFDRKEHLESSWNERILAQSLPPPDGEVAELVVKLKAAAAEATPGPWHLKMNDKQTEAEIVGEDDDSVTGFDLGGTFQFEGKRAHEKEVALATYIALANPANVLTLIAEIERLTAERDAHKAKLAAAEEDNARLREALGRIIAAPASGRSIARSALSPKEVT